MGFESSLLELIESSAGLRLQVQQVQALNLAFERAANERQMSSEALLEALREGGRESELLTVLQGICTIPETHFYRIAPQIQALKTVLMPELIARCAPERRLRFWSAGCSSGEEVYTLLMLLEELGGLTDWDVRVLGTDLNLRVLELARTGTYGLWSFRDTPLAAIEQFFDASGGRYRVRDFLRQRANFQVANLLDAAATEPSFELILCRNVTLYFAPSTAQRVYEQLAAQLLPGGYLMLGPSDPPMQQATLERSGLEMVLLPGVIVWKKPEPSKLNLKARFSQSEMSPQPRASVPSPPDQTEVPSWKTYLHDGQNHLKLEHHELAIVQFRRAMFLEPNEPLPSIGLAQACLALGLHTRALSALRHARRLLTNLEPEKKLNHSDLTSFDGLNIVNGLLERIKLQQGRS
jgi:chemotaxis protein methyltransferase CheR